MNKPVAIVAVIATTFLYNRWMLDPRAFFYADDWTWLWHAQFIAWGRDYFALLPLQAYNDRPVGAAFIKALYQLFGLDHRSFQIALLLVHALNCYLLYIIANRFSGHLGALLAALLAAVWFSANSAVNWVAASFDLVGATFCLSTLALRQLASRSRHPLRWDIAGAACYLLAIRSKEFALGMVALLFVMNVLVERQSLRATFRQLLPYLLVFGVCAGRYAQLLTTVGPASDSPYHLDLRLATIIESVGLYTSGLFYAESVSDLLVVGGLLVLLGFGFLLAGDKARRIALFAMAGFVIMLGPTLLLPSHRQLLYLYTPHFFVALAIGALFTGVNVPSAVAVAVSLAVVAPPTWIHYRRYAIDFYLAKGEVSQAQFLSAVKLLGPVAPATTIVISGVEPFYNSFYHPPYTSLNILFGDKTIRVIAERPEAELVDEFCQAADPKRFLRFSSATSSDVTSEIVGSCSHPQLRSG